ncbi:hypothetical protein F5B22DRAFT_609206 [Xylaria bambusicola]|uniref:uncharacterized protein n=1 Tax=Xylaria bambusicola TaxID=326684 RepID=UPI002007A111|nr:uncharacterized protein F5B22DRAFT_609206 [Xylaria bambusicola]KAI0514970.1 hypothetical protein F5B22DRAFT_609206 [Xylaria bambusicola]
MTGYFEYNLPFRGVDTLECAYLPLEVVWQWTQVCPPMHQHLPHPPAAYFVEKLHEKKKEWEATSEYATLQKLIASNPAFSTARKIFGIALGSMRDVREIHRQNSAAQYCLLRSMGELIAKAAKSNEVRCFAQDPQLTPPVIEALSRIGIQTIDDPQAFLDLDDTSFVISSAPVIPVKQIVADLARPVAMMWNPPSGDKRNFLS